MVKLKYILSIPNETSTLIESLCLVRYKFNIITVLVQCKYNLSR